MKKLFVIMAALLLTFGAGAQDKEMKGFQFGVNYRTEFVNLIHSQQSANLSPGYRINRGNYVGLRSGYIFTGHTYCGCRSGYILFPRYPCRRRIHSLLCNRQGQADFDHRGSRRRLVYNTTPVVKPIPYVGVMADLAF